MLFELLALIGSWLRCFLFAGYMSPGSAFPKPLTPAEENELVVRMRDGDVSARDTLIERNLRLVAHVVKKYGNVQETDNEDLISIGTIGLIKAVDSFKGDKNIRLATYAARCIHNEILMHFRAQKHKRCEVSLDEPVGADGEGNSISLMHILHDEAESIEDGVMLKNNVEKLYAGMRDCLSAREREVLALRFGLGEHDALPQREIAKKMNISRSYISRIEKKAIDKLRACMQIVDGREME